MNKAYILVICMLGASFVGCIDEEESDDGPKNAIYAAIEDLENGDYESFCKMGGFVLEDNLIILADETEIKECIAESNEADNETTIPILYNLTINKYKEVKINGTLSNSGPIYEVTTDLEFCVKFGTDPWYCSTEEEDLSYYTKVSGQWLDITNEWEALTIAPQAVFIVAEDSAGWYHVDVVKVTRVNNLEDYSYYLKDTNGSTHIGRNGFGEIAMQMIGSHGGDEQGIDMRYDGDNQQLRNRASNVSDDDGSNFPVKFSDNDRDGKLSAGDQFLIAGMGNSANGPAEDGWRLDIQYDLTGDIMGSAKLL